MALRIGTASQKGGVYKSAIARALLLRHMHQLAGQSKSVTWILTNPHVMTGTCAV
nr:hypothetical protein pPsy0479b_00072 [Pseudomonas syringae]